MIPVADAHCDFLYYMVNEGCDIKTLAPEQSIYLPYMKQGGVALQFFAAWVDTKKRTSALQQTLDMFDAYYRMLNDNPDFVPFDSNYDPACGKISTILSVEGGEAIEGSLANLRLFRRLGVRAMTLTWNETNELAAPAMRKGEKGLTRLGKEVVREMCDIGIAVDVAHLGDAGVDDILEIATRPIFASHSNARSLAEHKRCLCDRHIKAIAEQGGLVCVNFYPKHLTGGNKASIEDVVRHVCYIAELAGVEHVGFGSDFNGMVNYPVDLHNSADFPPLIDALRRAGFDDASLKKIAYENLAGYMKQFC